MRERARTRVRKRERLTLERREREREFRAREFSLPGLLASDGPHKAEKVNNHDH